MSLLEATVWATVSQYFVPQRASWLEPLLAPMFFTGIFAVIWVVDVSFITSEKPTPQREVATTKNPGRRSRFKRTAMDSEKIPWWFGVVLRLAIILVSVLITAPFLTQVIRSDEIRQEYQQLIDQARKAKESELVSLFEEQINNLTGQRRRLEQERSRHIQDAEDIDERVTNDQRDLREEVERYKQAYEDEISGRGGRTAGYGPKAKQAEAALNDAQAALEKLRLERNIELAQTRKLIQGFNEDIAKIDQEIASLNEKRADLETRFSDLSPVEFAKQYGIELPADNLGTRVRLMEKLREEEQKGMGATFLDRFKSVEGLSQALLGILFLSLLALKFFEPKAVQLYFNETLQHQWRRYQTGEFDDIPGFEPYSERSSPFAFADAYRMFTNDPDRFF